MCFKTNKKKPHIKTFLDYYRKIFANNNMKRYHVVQIGKIIMA